MQEVGGHEGAYGPLVTDVDRGFVLPKRDRLVVENLLGSGKVSGTAITYPVFGPLEGGTGFVGEGKQKPQLHVADPSWRTDALSEVAGWFKMTDDMAEDLDYVASEINSTARYDLAQRTEQALLSGDGSGSNLLGIRNREGVQSHAIGDDSAADALFKAMGKVQTATGFSADALVINPLDYETAAPRQGRQRPLLRRRILRRAVRQRRHHREPAGVGPAYGRDARGTAGRAARRRVRLGREGVSQGRHPRGVDELARG